MADATVGKLLEYTVLLDFCFSPPLSLSFLGLSWRFVPPLVCPLSLSIQSGFRHANKFFLRVLFCRTLLFIAMHLGRFVTDSFSLSLSHTQSALLFRFTRINRVSTVNDRNEQSSK